MHTEVVRPLEVLNIMFQPEGQGLALGLVFITLAAWGLWISARKLCRCDLPGFAVLSITTQLLLAVLYAVTLGQVCSVLYLFSTRAAFASLSHVVGIF